MAEQQVFISYAWGGESEIVADELETILTAHSFRLIRDKTNLGFKGLIREFMQQIGQGNLVVLVIGDKYLKSKNCMFELLEVAKNGEFHNRIFPVVLPDADIYDSLGILSYLKYWDQKIKELNASAKELDNLADTRKVQEDINLYTDIRAAIDDLAGKIGNMNTLTLEIMRDKKYQPLLDALQQTTSPASTPFVPSKKEGKVLYHIPRMMQINTWTRCIVRLAWDEIFLTEGLKLPADQLEIEPIRLARVMQVTLSEGRDGHAFEIKALNNEEQFIFDDDFTEWLYDVKPFAVGNFTLILRITLIHIIEGQQRKKDLVLEREVTTETLVPKALPKFETAERGLLPSRAEPGSPKPVKLEEMIEPEPDYSKVYPELSEDNFPPEQQSYPRKMGAPAPASFPSSPRPIFPLDRPTLAPPRKQTFKRLMPYVASIFGISVVAVLIFLGGNQSSIPESATTDNDHVASKDTVDFLQEKMVVALTLDAISPDGQQVRDVQLFVIESNKTDSLSLLDFGAYTLSTYPVSDTMDRNLTEIGNYTIGELRDSVERLAKKPIRVGSNLIDRRNLKVRPE